MLDFFNILKIDKLRLRFRLILNYTLCWNPSAFDNIVIITITDYQRFLNNFLLCYYSFKIAWSSVWSLVLCHWSRFGIYCKRLSYDVLILRMITEVKALSNHLRLSFFIYLFHCCKLLLKVWSCHYGQVRRYISGQSARLNLVFLLFGFS